jgi:hypothetical protein
MIPVEFFFGGLLGLEPKSNRQPRQHDNRILDSSSVQFRGV